MQAKFIEIRDVGTCIAALALRMIAEDTGGSLTEHRFMRREGFPKDGSAIVLMKLGNQKATSDPYEWFSLTGNDRTMKQAHNWILAHWDDIVSGQVIDVQVILGERDTPKTPEIGVYA